MRDRIESKISKYLREAVGGNKTIIEGRSSDFNVNFGNKTKKIFDSILKEYPSIEKKLDELCWSAYDDGQDYANG